MIGSSLLFPVEKTGLSIVLISGIEHRFLLRFPMSSYNKVRFLRGHTNVECSQLRKCIMSLTNEIFKKMPVINPTLAGEVKNFIRPAIDTIGNSITI